jgi:hypothetical protein
MRNISDREKNGFLIYKTIDIIVFSLSLNNDINVYIILLSFIIIT